MSDEQRVTLGDGREVIMRHSRQGDAERVHAYICALGRSTDMILTYEDDLPPIERIQSHIDMIPKGQFYSLVAIDPESGDVVGNASFRFAVRKKLMHAAELGMGVLPSHQRVGLGSMMLNRAIEDMKSHPTIERLDLTVIASNTHAREMYLRAGFVEEGVKIRSLKQPDGTYDDEVVMGMWICELGR
ncbi:MAG: GNAT family N-acetyltransferase [Phycisphaerales bacterium]|nr:GNAT family N-acetyltransferase [Phycisphaerales bacterium]